MNDGIVHLFTWRSAIVKSDLGPISKYVAIIISLHMNELGESAFPKGSTMAEESSLSESTVWKHVKLLEQWGWLSHTKRPFSSNLYHTEIPSLPDGVPSLRETETNSTSNSSDNSSTIRSLPFAEDFEIAYKVYPRHEGRVKAHRTYVAQRRKGADPAQLLAACQKMAIDCRGTDTKYVKLMATFLGPDDWWKEKLGNSDTDVESPATLCPTCFLDHHGEECPFEREAANAAHA